MDFVSAKILETQSVKHGFFGRKGGVSEGEYESLNCRLASKDAPDHVIENRLRVGEALLGVRTPIHTLYQNHTDICRTIDKAPLPEERLEGDALVTDTPDVVIGALTADCVPVLFIGEKKQDGTPVIGAAHAGWRGALGGILASTVQAMADKGCEVENIRAAIGPCIGPASYEVGEDFAKAFLAQDNTNEHFFRPARREGHLMFDLPGYCAARLSIAGLSKIEITGQDTYAQAEDFFSHRRSVHEGRTDYGCQVAAIVIQKS